MKYDVYIRVMFSRVLDIPDIRHLGTAPLSLCFKAVVLYIYLFGKRFGFGGIIDSMTFESYLVQAILGVMKVREFLLKLFEVHF